MKNVLIIIQSFHWGGINKSLQSWLSSIDSKEIAVDIFACVPLGEFMEGFNNCHILASNQSLTTLLNHKEYQKGTNAILFIILKVLNKLTKGRLQRWMYSRVGNKLVSAGNYDAVIAWGEGVPTVFVSQTEHPNRIAWIHCDYAQYTSSPTERDVYQKFKSIVCVSKYTKQTFLSYYPEMEGRVHAIYNILDVNEIHKRAKEPIDIKFDKSVFNIVSVGRVAPIKRFSDIPTIAKKLIDAGCQFKWYIVGPYSLNDEYKKIRRDTQAYGLEEHVIMLGGKSNPYPYIANANLHVCTSLSESWSYAVNEANVLGVPSISTDFGAIYESIQGNGSMVVAPIESIDKTIGKMITDNSYYSEVASAVASFTYDNYTILNQIAELLDTCL